MRTRGPTFFTIALIAIVLLGLIAVFGSGLYTDWLWFDNLGFSSVYLLGIFARIAVGLASGLVVAVFLWLNLNLALAGRVGSMPGIIELPIGPMIAPRRIRRYLTWISLIAGGFLGLSVSGQWLNVLKWLRQTPFGIVDPVFGKDVAHYLFTLPVMAVLYQLLIAALVLAGIGVLLIYTLTGDLSFDVRRIRLSGRARAHASLLLAGILATKALGYRIMLYNLNYSPRGQVFGASFTDVNAQAVALRLLFFISLALAAFLIANLRLRRTNLILWGIAFMLAVSFILGNLYPAFVQQFTVEPDEINKEAPYIKHNINFTRHAWDLESIEEVEYAVGGTLTLSELLANTGTAHPALGLSPAAGDIRPTAGNQALLRLQRRRYRPVHLGDDYRQVSPAVRELDTDKLPEKTWINQHLVYTHGYGAVVSPVNRATASCLLELWVKDVPPLKTGPAAANGLTCSKSARITASCPGLRYRQHGQPEFDYLLGEATSTNHYDGRGGVRLSSPLVRLAFALWMRSYQIFLANVVTSESRIMFYRNIQEACEDRPLPDVRPRPVRGAERRQPLLDDRRLHLQLGLSVPSSRCRPWAPTTSAIRSRSSSMRITARRRSTCLTRKIR